MTKIGPDKYMIFTSVCPECNLQYTADNIEDACPECHPEKYVARFNIEEEETAYMKGWSIW